MAACISCKSKKAKRNCPALGEGICPECCGTKRGKRIQCPEDCNYFIQGKIKDNEKAVNQLVKESFNDDTNDLYKKKEVYNVVGPLEAFLFEEYYMDIRIKDSDVYICLIKIYYTLDGKGGLYQFSVIEQRIFDEFKKITEEEKTPADLQKTIVLRLMKSVQMLTGGLGGNRNYFETLRGQFTGTGHMAHMFGEG